jgi:hypothetical protein
VTTKLQLINIIIIIIITISFMQGIYPYIPDTNPVGDGKILIAYLDSA